MPTGNQPEKGFGTDMKHTAGVSDPRKRKVEDTEYREAHEEASPYGAKRHKKQRHTQPVSEGTSKQQTNDTNGQGVDEMDIDSNKKEGELDSKLMKATKKMGIKPFDEVKNDVDWAELYAYKCWQSSGTSSSRR